MDRLDRLDSRQFALVLSRGRAVIGLSALFLPGLVNRAWFGQKATPHAKALTRLLGVRDVVLGVGALTSVKEQTQGPEWLSMGAVADGVDALVTLFLRDAPKRSRLLAAGAAGSAVVAMVLARDLADQRAAVAGSTFETSA
jgi:hypothetical protein